MNTVIASYASKCQFQRFRTLLNIQPLVLKYLPIMPCLHFRYTTTIDAVDAVTNNLIRQHTEKLQCKQNPLNKGLSFDYLLDPDNSTSKDMRTLVTTMSNDQIDDIFMEMLTKNEHNKVEQLLKECERSKKIIGKLLLYKLFQTYSYCGKINMVVLLKSYVLKVNPNMYARNGEYEHYLARAKCMKGNSDQGLSLLKLCYSKNENLRGVYRCIFRDLINDSVQNRSEASLVIFKRYVLEFSDIWNDHYPLICFWHICWTSHWFSDQMLADELLGISESLRNIIQERAAALSYTILRNEFNEDAVVRLLQTLLKYDMMLEYSKVLEILFGYKLKNGDIRGCREIIHNCKVLDITLPSDQQGKYIKLLINKDHEKPQTTTVPSKNFKLKF